MYEGLVKKLRELGNWLGYTEWTRDAFFQAADAIEELQKVVNSHKINSEFWEAEYKCLADENWISVATLLPRNGQDVLACRNTGHTRRIVPANYDNGEWFDCCSDYISSRKVIDHITHWMPLPYWPEEVEE